MATLRAMSSVFLLLMLCGAHLHDARAWGQQQTAKPGPLGGITADEAKSLEEGLKTSPDNLIAREELIRYYFEANLLSQDPKIEERRDEQIFWLIENHPEVDLAGSPEADIQPVGYPGSAEKYQHGKELWLAQAGKHSDNAKILRSAAQFIFLYDREDGRKLLEEALAIEPGDQRAASMLALSYTQERDAEKSPEAKAGLAEKALAVRQGTLNNADQQERFYALADLANSALEAGHTAQAEQYAQELLRLAAEFTHNWNYGNAVHKGNIVLGRIALRDGNIVAAKEYLIAAGKTPGSPQLDSFGPNMTLAKELLEKGERDVVLAYLNLCAQFWKMGDSDLKNWRATIKGGGVPDFGANLNY
jgi:hypothetical protein